MVPGFLAGVLAHVSGVKAALAGVTAVATMGLAGGAAGILPGPAQNVVATAVNAATPFEFPEAGDATGAVGQALPAVPQAEVTVPSVPNLPVQPPVSVSAGVKAGSTSASAQTGTSGVTPTVPNVTVPTIPQVTVPPALSGLVNGLPACVRDLVPATGSTPDPTALAAKIRVCIPQILSTANLPPEVKACVSSVLGTIGGAGGLNPTTIPGVSGLSLSSCVPMDVSKCVTNMMGFLGTLPGLSGGSIPGVGSFPGFGSSGLPGLSSISGCVPMDVNKCITSITSAVSAGTVPRLDLSACMPTTLPGTGTIPGLGSISNLPGLSGALPFFGR